jgi:hypothetical protein
MLKTVGKSGKKVAPTALKLSAEHSSRSRLFYCPYRDVFEKMNPKKLDVKIDPGSYIWTVAGYLSGSKKYSTLEMKIGKAAF